MNKLLQHMTSRRHAANQTVNQNHLSAMPSQISINLNIDAETWRYFDRLDEDSRGVMARILKDYVDQQK